MGTVLRSVQVSGIKYPEIECFKILILTTATSLAIIPTINKRTRAFLFGGYSG